MAGRRWVLAAVAALAVGSLADPAGARRKNVKDRGERLFGHAAHADLVETAGKDALSCEGACHRSDAEGKFLDGGSGKRAHDRCDGCHTFTFSRAFVQGKGGRVCLPCHKKPSGFRVAVGPVNERADPTHATVYSHRRHVMPRAATGRQCEGCHGKFGEAAPRTRGALSVGHEFCAGCHERGVEPLMKQCDGCHVGEASPRYKTPVVKKRRPSRYAVSGAFSHKRHAREDRVGTQGRECLTCHDNIAGARSDAVVPMPTMEGCHEDCHDGKKAFSATGTQCGRCHPSSAGQAQKKPVAARFSHGSHRKQGVRLEDCESCHRLDDRFTVLPATTGRGHQPCARSGCHAGEFFSREPKICGVCHDRVEPFARPKPIVRRRRESEFGGDLSHASHMKKVGGAGGANGPCKACHGDVYRGERSPGGGHATCAPCHGKPAEPGMRACGGCHRLGETRAALTGGTSKWAVAARFTHDVHRSDPRKGAGETRCVECHQSIPGATRLAEIENPTMPSCDACHDGELAFKTTGFECVRCHGGEEP